MPPDSADPPLLSIRGLIRSGIDMPDFGLAAGEALAVLGPSGSGKTLFLRALADLDENDGAVMLGGDDRRSVPAPDWRVLVAYVAAESGWWADTVSGHFKSWDSAWQTGCRTLGSRPSGAPIGERLGLPVEAGGWPVSRLSTGERQRLALLRALEVPPLVLLLDEPTSGLDETATAAVEALLRDFLEQGGGLVFTTHDQAQAGRLAARCLKFAGNGAAELCQCR